MEWDWNTESFIPVYFDYQDIMQDIELPGTALAMHYESVGFLFFPNERNYN